jgi:hypothetical protein
MWILFLVRVGADDFVGSTAKAQVAMRQRRRGEDEKVR